ncbi:MAG: hypothetical protein J5713_03270 [Clostridia bacterium]|nr:hypothetical protein [Clostridia bacterium]
MKKKLIISVLAIMVIVSAIFALSACNRSASPQGQLSNFLIDHGKEYFEYDVNDGQGSIGTYKVTITIHQNGATINCPEAIENVSKGILVESELDVTKDGKHSVYQTGCYFNLVNGSSLMVPAHTYRIQSEDGNETFRMTGTYDGSTFRYDKKVGEDTTSGSLKLSGTYFDNNEFQQCLRAVSTFSTSFNMSFATPLVSLNETAIVNLTASCSKVVNVVNTPYTDSFEEYATEGVACYKVQLSRSTKVAGVAHILYYAKSNVKATNAPDSFTLQNVLIEFHEPLSTEGGETQYLVYKLKKAEIY